MTSRKPALTNASLQAGTARAGYKSQSSREVISSTSGADLPSTSSTSRYAKPDPYHPHSYTYVSHSNAPRYENSYIVEPDSPQRFNPQRAARLCSDVLHNHLEHVKYEPARCKELTTLICEEIKMRLKSITYKRYKIVVSLSICQNVDTNILIASRALWDTATDNCCSVTFKNSSLHAIATVFAVYYD
jgi:hypothetical protein